MSDLKKSPTKELVEELSKREAVHKFLVGPYEKFGVTTVSEGMYETGPAVILVITD